jgi:hypothetical protein
METALAIRDEQQYLAAVSEIRSLVERIASVDEAKDLADKARAAQVWAERAGLAQAQVNLAVVAKLWAERRAGELLAASVTRAPNMYRADTSLPANVSRVQSSRWQKLARLPLKFYEGACNEAVAAGRISLQEVFRRAERLEREDDAAKAEAALVVELSRHGGPSWSIEQADVRNFDPGLVDAIVTDPPYITEDAVDLYRALGEFATRSLKPGGALVAMTWQPLLPAVFAALSRPELTYRWTIAWVSGSHESTADYTRRVFDRWKPVLVFHRGTWLPKTRMLADVVGSGRDPEKGEHPWQQTLGGFRQLVRAVSAPGETICDPFVGAGTTCLAALAENRSFVGCDISPEAVAIANERLAA